MTTIKIRGDTLQNWNDINSTPAERELCSETDTGRLKIGNGSTPYKNLNYLDGLHSTNVNSKDIDSKGGVFNGDFSIGNGSSRTDSKGWIGDESTGWNIALTISSVEAAIENNSIRLSTLDSTGSIRVSMSPSDFYISPYTPEDRRYLIPVKPNTKYRLSYWTKLKNIVKSTIWYQTKRESDFENVDSSGNTGYLSGTVDWTYVEKIIDMGAEANYFAFTLYNEDPGNISDVWFKDIKLEEISTATVGTEIPAPAGVQISGSTTTDNVDQSQTEGDERLASIYVGSSAGQTFIPTEENHTALVALTDFAGDHGTEFRVLLYKWDTDFVTTINTSVIADTGNIQIFSPKRYIRYELPCKLVPGEKYLYYVTGNGTDTDNCIKIRGTTANTYPNGEAYFYENGVATESGDWNFKTLFAKNTKDPVVSVNGKSANLENTELLSYANVVFDQDGNGKYIYNLERLDDWGGHPDRFTDVYEHSGSIVFRHGDGATQLALTSARDSLWHTWKFEAPEGMSFKGEAVFQTHGNKSINLGRFWSLLYSYDNQNWYYLENNVQNVDGGKPYYFPVDGQKTVYIKELKEPGNDGIYTDGIYFEAELYTNVQLPSLTPSDEIQSEAHDLSVEPVDFRDTFFIPLENDLRGWSGHNIVMLASEEEWTAQAVSPETIYIYDSNGTTAWTWNSRNGVIPPADRTSGKVLVKYLVGDNQILTAINDGSFEANFKLFWQEGDVRKSIELINNKINKEVNASKLNGKDENDFVDKVNVNAVNQDACIKLGDYYLWVDSTGSLRVKSGEPTSDTDGTVVGTQT